MGAHLYYWADSSPQGGRDWLLTRYDSVSTCDVVSAFRSAVAMQQSKVQVVDLLGPAVAACQDGDGAMVLHVDGLEQVIDILLARAILSLCKID